MPPDVSLAGTHHDHEPTIEELKRELAEARDQQVATSEILRIISSSPGDLQPVLDTIVATATRLCGAEKATIRRRSGDAYLMVAEYGCSPEQRAYMEKNPVAAGPGTVVGRAGETRKPVYVADVEADPGFRQMDLATGAGFRAALAVPLLREGEIIGVLMLLHSKPYPFTAHHIERAQTFADQAVIAIENARLFEAEQVRTREVEEALETQTATAAILRVIASSPSDLALVLSAVAERASRLCGAFDALVLLRKGDELQTLAHYGPIPAHASGPIARDWVIGRAFVDRTLVQVEDLTAAGADFPRGYAMAIRDGFRTSLAIPMQRKAEPVGVICVRRTEPRPFTEKQIALLLTFADQAVIAIENARLFEAEQASKRELQESLEYQTATSEVLSVISRSPTNVQAVFETIARSAARLCSALNCFVYRFDGKLVHFAAADRLSEGEARVRSMYPLPTGRASAATRAILNGAVEEIPDVELDTDYQHLAGAQAEGYHSIVAVPMLKDGRTVGAIAVSRSHVGRFPPRQIELLQTFAGQAVIAIENTRLFEEVQARTHELTESLEYQTATSDVLGVISQSPTQLQPVVDAIVQTAKRLCEAERAHIWRLRDGRFDLLAHTLNDTELTAYLEQNPIPTGPNSFAGRAVLEKRVVHVPDVSAHPEIGTQGQLQRTHVRTMLVVPLLREGEPIGVLSLTRTKVPRPFSDKQIELVTTFASQAVIAINNVGLFGEVQARNRDLTALGEVGRAVSSTLDLRAVLKTIVDRAVILSGTDAGSIFYYREQFGRFELGETTGLDEDVIGKLRKIDIAAKDTGLGEAIANRQPLPIPDLTQRPSEPLRDAVLEAGFRASLIVPLLAVEGPIGTLILRRRQPGPFPASVVSLMQAFADQSAIALENARLFDEIAQKSHELEIASQHKSQFVANMSHELRTPLAAILGYAELMQEGFYEPLGQKSLDALTRIRSNGKHLLGLINTVLDIAKIESGQFNLNLGEYALENVVETVRAATEALAETKKLGLKTDVAKRLPIGVGDEQRLTQVLLNLVGNAIKFTDAGEVRIIVTASNGHFAVSVTDTGPGIPQEHQARIFEQFHQVDSSNTKAKGGTGLGLAIAKQIVEMHGGRIWVESILGQGATFQLELPIRAAAHGVGT